jgi:hypothetical protein
VIDFEQPMSALLSTEKQVKSGQPQQLFLPSWHFPLMFRSSNRLSKHNYSHSTCKILQKYRDGEATPGRGTQE